MSFKTPLLCDRRVYDKKGKWQNPNNDIADNIFYFIKEPKTMVSEYIGGREELKEQLTIVVFGEKPIIKDDDIILDTGEVYKVQNITTRYVEHNVLVKDMLKPRIESLEIILE